jgi:hypothetical protein
MNEPELTRIYNGLRSLLDDMETMISPMPTTGTLDINYEEVVKYDEWNISDEDYPD